MFRKDSKSKESKSDGPIHVFVEVADCGLKNPYQISLQSTLRDLKQKVQEAECVEVKKVFLKNISQDGTVELVGDDHFLVSDFKVLSQATLIVFGKMLDHVQPRFHIPMINIQLIDFATRHSIRSPFSICATTTIKSLIDTVIGENIYLQSTITLWNKDNRQLHSESIAQEVLKEGDLVWVKGTYLPKYILDKTL